MLLNLVIYAYAFNMRKIDLKFKLKLQTWVHQNFNTEIYIGLPKSRQPLGPRPHYWGFTPESYWRTFVPISAILESKNP